MEFKIYITRCVVHMATKKIRIQDVGVHMHPSHLFKGKPLPSSVEPVTDAQSYVTHSSESSRSCNPVFWGGATLHAWFPVETCSVLVLFLAEAQWTLCLLRPWSRSAVQILSLQLAFWFASALNRSFNLKLACKFEGLGFGKKFLLSVLNSNHLEAHRQHFNLVNGQRQTSR